MSDLYDIYGDLFKNWHECVTDVLTVSN